MQSIELIRLQLNHLVTQARHDIYILSTLNDLSMKQPILQRLWDTLSSIHFLSELVTTQATTNYHTQLVQQPLPIYNGNTTYKNTPAITPLPNQKVPQTIQRTFNLKELAKYDGKNGRPAYVAVNGMVYDVTNNRAWAAATHFGLVSGKDYTTEFASCHAGQQSILATLPVVGRLV